MPKADASEVERPRLGLGTVQFGIDYGVTNRNGKPSDAAVAHILSDALKHGVGVIDTAPVYGDAELRLGKLLPANIDCPIVTKTASRPQLTQVTKEDAAFTYDRFLHSLKDLNRETVYGLLVHLGTEILLPGGERLLETLAAIRDAGLATKIGVSVYDAEELDGILRLFVPEIVQLPLSIADQRLLQSGHIAKLKALGVEIHVRSAFLQGVLLADPTTLPPFMNKYVPKLEKIRTAHDDATPLEICLAFMRQIPEVDCVIAGAATLNEWESIRSTHSQCRDLELHFASMAIEEPQFLNPSNWPKGAN